MPAKLLASPTTERLQLSIRANAGRAHIPFLRRHVKRAHALLVTPLRELSIALVGDRAMSELHEQFLSIAGPTDVLTFPLDINTNGQTTAGEVVLCVPEARRQAKAHGTTLENELLLYAIHGLLHLCGHDDRTAAGYALMHRTEDQLLTRLGVGAVFASPPPRRTIPKRATRPRRTLRTPGPVKDS
jgi:probable rRNA maturation factor